jgi:hypothetical protein
LHKHFFENRHKHLLCMRLRMRARMHLVFSRVPDLERM